MIPTRVLFVLLAFAVLLSLSGCAAHRVPLGSLPQPEELTAGTRYQVWPDGLCTVTIFVSGTPPHRRELPPSLCQAMQVAKASSVAAAPKPTP